jgi:hypothetical protein
MPKITTSYVDGCYYPKILSEEELKDYQTLGFGVADVSQEVWSKWKEHQKQVEYWHKFWMDMDNEIWDGE